MQRRCRHHLVVASDRDRLQVVRTQAELPTDRPIDGVDQSGFFLGKTEASSREGILIWCADRLQAVKWRHYKVHFYQQETMIAPPVKLPLPFLFNLYTNPQEDETKTILDSWIIGPVLKMIGSFEESTKKYPLIPMGMPDPYRPPTESPLRPHRRDHGDGDRVPGVRRHLAKGGRQHRRNPQRQSLQHGGLRQVAQHAGP
jgi:arylsulfatase